MKKSGLLVVAICLGGGLPMASAQEDTVDQAYALRMSGKTDDARRMLVEALGSNADNAAAWFELARLEVVRSVSVGELDTAQRAIEKALELDGENALYLHLAGEIAAYNFIMKHHAGAKDEYLPQMEKATEALERALQIDPDLHAARRLLISCYGNNPANLGGDRAKAEEHVEAMEKRSPARGLEARCEFARKNTRERHELWNALAKERADDPVVQENLARIHAGAGDAAKAIAHADRALELDAGRGKILLGIGVKLAFDRKLDPAREILQRYLEHEPEGPRALQAYAQMLIGRIQKMQGDAEAGEQSVKRARELDAYVWPTMRPPSDLLFEAP